MGQTNRNYEIITNLKGKNILEITHQNKSDYEATKFLIRIWLHFFPCEEKLKVYDPFTKRGVIMFPLVLEISKIP